MAALGMIIIRKISNRKIHHVGSEKQIKNLFKPTTFSCSCQKIAIHVSLTLWCSTRNYCNWLLATIYTQLTGYRKFYDILFFVYNSHKVWSNTFKCGLMKQKLCSLSASRPLRGIWDHGNLCVQLWYFFLRSKVRSFSLKREREKGKERRWEYSCYRKRI